MNGKKTRANSINGTIELVNTEVQQDVETTDGDIRLSAGSVVIGDVVFHEIGSWFHGGLKRPKLVVDASSAIKGAIHLYQKVNLKIDDDADVGEIVEHY